MAPAVFLLLTSLAGHPNPLTGESGTRNALQSPMNLRRVCDLQKAVGSAHSLLLRAQLAARFSPFQSYGWFFEVAVKAGARRAGRRGLCEQEAQFVHEKVWHTGPSVRTSQEK